MEAPDQLEKIAVDAMRDIQESFNQIITDDDEQTFLEIVAGRLYRVQRDTMIVSLLAFQGIGEPDDIGKDGRGKNGDGGPRLTVDEDGSISLG